MQAVLIPVSIGPVGGPGFITPRTLSPRCSTVSLGSLQLVVSGKLALEPIKDLFDMRGALLRDRPLFRSAAAGMAPVRGVSNTSRALGRLFSSLAGSDMIAAPSVAVAQFVTQDDPIGQPPFL